MKNRLIKKKKNGAERGSYTHILDPAPRANGPATPPPLDIDAQASAISAAAGRATHSKSLRILPPECRKMRNSLIVNTLEVDIIYIMRLCRFLRHVYGARAGGSGKKHQDLKPEIRRPGALQAALERNASTFICFHLLSIAFICTKIHIINLDGDNNQAGIDDCDAR